MEDDKVGIHKLSKWQILIDCIPADHPIIGTGKDYWAFTIYRGSDEENIFCGSADDLATCLDMAKEGFEIVSS